VSVIGAVRVPGIYQLKGQKSLLDVLASAQGLTEEAGNAIHVIRRPLNGSSSENQEKQLIMIDVEELMQKGKTDLNIPIYAGDVINVLNAGAVFVVGEVLRPGEFALRYGRNVTISQALALGGGLTKYAKKKEGVVIRYHADGTKEEIPVNIEKIMVRGSSNSAADVLMKPNDILFVPSSSVRTGFSKALDSAVMIAVGRAIYHY
jgi:polysaccharide export outer membrane protein